MFGTAPLSFWIGFHALLALLLLAEYLLLRKGTPARSYIATALWIAGALSFAAAIHFGLDDQRTTEFLAGYAIEESLSIDNLFVFLLLFESFRIEPAHQRKVLFWGILLAVLMRAGFIFAGVQLLARVEWITYAFGIILLIAAIRLVLPKKKETVPTTPLWLKALRRLTPISNRQDAFFAQETPIPKTAIPDSPTQKAPPGIGPPRTVPSMLFVTLITIAITDLVFAIDSIPAVLSLTKHPFIAYTSNVLAVMGLRSLFFVLTHLLERLRFLHYGLAAILAFAAFKMLAANVLELSAVLSLGIILGLLAITVAASLLSPRPPVTAP
jgi:tellurite resistance protein TerC